MVGELCLLQFALDQLVQYLHNLWLVTCVHILNALSEFVCVFDVTTCSKPTLECQPFRLMTFTYSHKWVK